MSKCKRVKLGEACDVRDGTHDSPKYVDIGFPLVTSKNLSTGNICLDNINYISETDYKKINERSFVDDGDILMPMIGTIGSPVIIKKAFDFAIKNVALIKCCDEELVFNKFIAYVLSSNQFQRYIEQENRGGTQKFISLSDIRKFEFVLPPIEEQKRIAEIIDKASNLISLRKKQIGKLDLLVQSRFVEMFGDLKHNEREWEIVPFSSVAIIDTHMTDDFETYADYPHIGIENIEKDTGALVNYKTVAECGLISGKYLFDEHHIIYSKIRPNLNKVAMPTFKGLCSADAYPILPQSNCNRLYLAMVMRSEFFLEYILGHSGRTNIPKVNKIALGGFSLPLPPFELQNHFADFVSQVDKTKFGLQQGLEKLEMTYKALMQQYFN